MTHKSQEKLCMSLLRTNSIEHVITIITLDTESCLQAFT